MELLPPEPVFSRLFHLLSSPRLSFSGFIPVPPCLLRELASDPVIAPHPAREALLPGDLKMNLALGSGGPGSHQITLSGSSWSQSLGAPSRFPLPFAAPVASLLRVCLMAHVVPGPGAALLSRCPVILSGLGKKVGPGNQRNQVWTLVLWLPGHGGVS